MIFVTDKSKQELLAGAVKAREEELLHYQVNIDNYKLAIEEIHKTYPFGVTEEEVASGPFTAPTLEDARRINAVLFSYKLQELLTEHLLEYDKAYIMLQVLLQQLDGVDIKSLVMVETD